MIEVDHEYFKARFKEHYSYACKFVDALNDRYGVDLTVNANSFGVAVKSAYDDITRYKEYHLDVDQGATENTNARSDCVKRAAYMTKWLNRLRPIEKSGSINIPEIESILVNAHFSIFMIRNFIAAERGQPFNIDKEVQIALVYDFTYREISGDALLNVCFFLERIVSNRAIVQIATS